jgi:hypothetical protein
MSQRAKDISYRIKTFSDEVISFVMNLSEDDWVKECEEEQWPVGVTARHIAGHLSISDMADAIIKGKDLPPMTMDQIVDMANQSAREHADCSKSEVLKLLQKNTAEIVDYYAGLSDDDLDRKGTMPAFGGEVSAEQLAQFVILASAAQHLKSMKTAVGEL